MLKKIAFIIVMGLPVFALAQNGSEWVRSGQDYLKFSVSQDGLYSINGGELESQGWDISALDPEKIQMFYLGREMSILLKGTGDGRFDLEDEIWFYGERNRGILDSLVYRPTTARMNRNISLFEDESHYFLTLGAENGMRMEKRAYEEGPKLGHYIARDGLYFADEFSLNNSVGQLPNLQQSYYEPGEGWSGHFISNDSTSTDYVLHCPGVSSETGKNISISIQLNGRSPHLHHIYISVNDLDKGLAAFVFFDKNVKQIHMPVSALKDGSIHLSLNQKKFAEYEWYSVTNIEWAYPRALTQLGEGKMYMEEDGRVETFGSWFYEVSSPWEVQELENRDGYVSVESGMTLFRTDSLKKADMKKVDFISIDPEADYFIIASPSLKEGAEAYADYRSSEQGRGYKTTVLFASQLYDLYTYGFRNPMAVKRMADYVLSKSAGEKNLFLLGRTVTFPEALKTAYDPELSVPGLGYPGSDVLLTAGAGGSDENVQAFFTGRMNVTSNQQIHNYLEKVKSFESPDADQSYKQNFLHLSGGKTVDEINLLSNLLTDLEPKAESRLYGALVDKKVKRTFAEIELIDISEEVNKGVGFITFAGHGSAREIDLNFGYCSPPENGYQNKGKYPLLYFNGCGVGNVFWRYDPLSTDWLITPDKGAIAVFGNSYWSYYKSTYHFLHTLYEALFIDPESAKMSLGEIHKKINQVLKQDAFDPYIKADMHQVVLQGDPAIKMFPLSKADYAIEPEKLVIKSKDQAKPIAQNEYINVSLSLRNYGLYDSLSNFDIGLSVDVGDETLQYTQTIGAFRRENDYQFEVFLNSRQIKSIEVKVNPSHGLDEYSFSNNDYVFEIDDWSELSQNSVYPQSLETDKIPPAINVLFDGRQVGNEEEIARNSDLEVYVFDENSLLPEESELKLWLKGENASDFEEIPFSTVSNSGYNVVLGSMKLSLSPGTYTFRVSAKDAVGNGEGEFYEISVIVSDGQSQSTLAVLSNPMKKQKNAFVELNVPGLPSQQGAVVTLFDLNSRMLFDKAETITAGKNIFPILIGGLPGGTYVVQVSFSRNGKVEVLKTKLVIY